MRPIKIGNYILGEVIGSGTYAVVRLARHDTTNEKYAVKVIDRRKLDGKVYEKQTRREAKILETLNHPNIVQVKKMMKSRACTYIFMEYVEGGDLFSEIAKKSRLEEEEARRYFRQLTSAMCYAHGRQVMHRDIKPENILLDKVTDSIKIADFGMGYLKEEEERSQLTKSPCGTPKYMPPELLSHRGEGYCAAKLDVWSCGMVLYACLAGYVPYKCDTGDGNAILDEIMRREEIEFPEWMGEELRDLLSRSLEKDPVKRIDMRGLRDHAWTRGGGKKVKNVTTHGLDGKRVAMSPMTPAESGTRGGWA